MCMCANLEGQYHDESMSAPVDVRHGTPRRSCSGIRALSHCPASLWHAGWPRQSWSCWNQPGWRKEKQEENDWYSLYLNLTTFRPILIISPQSFYSFGVKRWCKTAFIRLCWPRNILYVSATYCKWPYASGNNNCSLIFELMHKYLVVLNEKYTVFPL